MTHPVVIGDGNVDLEDLPRLEGFQDLPATVGGAVDVGVVVAALPNQVRRVAGKGGANSIAWRLVLMCFLSCCSPHSDRGRTAVTRLD